jgi:uncharacterized protein (DUF697 family)
MLELKIVVACLNGMLRITSITSFPIFFPSCSTTCFLDPLQVEIVMGLEEEFGITVEESSAQSIATVEDAAELIDELVSKK